MPDLPRADCLCREGVRLDVCVCNSNTYNNQRPHPGARRAPAARFVRSRSRTQSACDSDMDFAHAR